MNGLWRKLVKLYHPDRFANEPDKLATYEKLTAAINRAKEAGDIQTLREIAEDPAGFILRQGWTGLDFSDEVELAELRRLHESLQLEIIAVIESLEQLKESAEYELCGIAEQRPGVLDELAAERTKLLEQESAELQQAGGKAGGGNQGIERGGDVEDCLAVRGIGQRQPKFLKKYVARRGSIATLRLRFQELKRPM